MILYTTMPQELVFQTPESEFGKQSVMEYEGIPLLVEMDENHDYRVIQVISSDPNHYLNNRCCPGVILSNQIYQ
jgi:hypothetical protein